ncbi:hypothetical protein Tco_0532423 [Tanacetum coccineum]
MAAYGWKVRTSPQRSLFLQAEELAENVSKIIDTQLADADEFSAVITKALVTLVNGLETKFDIEMAAMKVYVNNIKMILNGSIPVLGSILSPVYFQFFLDKVMTRCPVCNEGQETSSHLFIECPVAVGLWNMASAWWSCGNFPKDIHSLLVWGDNVNFSDTLKSCFDVVVQTTTWIIWRYRNQICFDLKPPRNDTLGEEIKVLSHCWIIHRNRKLNRLWLDWVFDPIKACKNSL